MEQPIPDWLDRDFLTECLQHEKNNQNIEVTSFNASLAAPAGNNYGACVVRAKVEYKESKEDHQLHSVSLIVKSEVTAGPMADFMNDTFKLKEPNFYKNYLPEAGKLTIIDFVPKSLFSSKPLTTVLEDLKEQNFAMADRIKQLDFDHCVLYMKAAASFHAVSFAVHKKNPELIESLGVTIETDSNTKTIFKIMIKNGLKCFADATSKVEKYKKYIKNIEDISENLWELVEEAQKPSSTLNTLTQGDPWTTNMMFKYDDKGAVKEVKLLDFQSLRYTCPINDLVFFIWSSATHDVRRNKIDELYKVYLEAFNRKLQEMNCSERMTMQYIEDNAKKIIPFTFYMVAISVPFFHDPDPVDFSVFLQSEKNPFEKYYTDSYCTNYFPKLLEQLELAGVFDYLENYQK